MKKQIVVATVALALAAPVVVHAEVEADFYGRVVAGAVYGDSDKGDGDDGTWDFGATDVDGSNGNHSRFGFKGSSDLGNGMEAGFKIEREIRAGDGGEDGTILRQRHNLVYLSGGFGKVTLGHQNNPYLNARNWDQTNFYGGNWHESYRHEGIQYSMSTGGFSLNIMALGNNANIDVDNAIEFADNAAGNPTECGTYNLAAGCGVKVSGNDGIDGWIIGAGYDFGVAAINVAHHADNKDIDITSAALDPTVPAQVLDARIAGSASADAFASRDKTAIGVNGSAGPVDWYLAYQTSELNASGNFDDNDIDAIGGFLGFRVSEKDTLYAYYVAHSADRNTYKLDRNDDGEIEGPVDINDVSLGEDYSETIFGYSRQIGPGVKFIAEYWTVDKDLVNTKDNENEPSKLALVIKMDF